MTGLVLPKIPTNPQLRRIGSDRLPATLGESVEASFGDPILRPTELFGRALDIERAETGEITDPFLLDEPDEPQPLTELAQPDALNEEFGHLGLTFKKPTRRRTAEILAEEKRAERLRADIIARGPRGFFAGTARLGAGFIGAAIDPLNIAAAFVPIIGEARFAGLLAKSAKITRETARQAIREGAVGTLRGATVARIQRGAIEGAAGNILIEPLVAGMSVQQQRDYGMADALANVAFGTILGGGLHGVGGKIGDLLRGHSPKTREIALRGAVSQVADGRRVDVASVFMGDLRGTTALASRGDLDRMIADAVAGARRAPAEARVGDRVFVPATRQDGRIRRFDTLDKARSVAKAGVTVRETPQGDFVLAREREEISVLRGSDGRPESFRTERAATKFLERTGRDPGSFTILRQGVAENRRFIAVEGLSPQEARVVRQDPDAVEVVEAAPDRTGPREGRRITAETQARPKQPQPEDDITADFEAASRVDDTLQKLPGELDDTSAETEVDFIRTQLEDLRAQGLLGDAEQAELGRIGEISTQADGLRDPIRQAAVCLARNA